METHFVLLVRHGNAPRLLRNKNLWSPTGKARGTSVKYPPAPVGDEIFRYASPGFGGVSASSVIRRSICPTARD